MSEDFQIPAKELAKHAPGLVRGFVEKALNDLNRLDLNKDGKSDVAQIAALVIQVVPLLAMLNEAIDFEKLADVMAESNAVKDKCKCGDAIKALGRLAEEAQGLIPKE